ncbi:MAG: hypothetical protein D6681_03830 [Calditrichaeota bacterium]|nr:MAG: hypothetical protein D6681_03830 [Calditrichota bacterium]
MERVTERSRLKKILSLRLRQPLRLFLKCDIVEIVIISIIERQLDLFTPWVIFWTFDESPLMRDQNYVMGFDVILIPPGGRRISL